MTSPISHRSVYISPTTSPPHASAASNPAAVSVSPFTPDAFFSILLSPLGLVLPHIPVFSHRLLLLSPPARVEFEPAISGGSLSQVKHAASIQRFDHGDSKMLIVTSLNAGASIRPRVQAEPRRNERFGVGSAELPAP